MAYWYVVLRPVHTSYNVEAAFYFVETTFDFCCQKQQCIRQCCFDIVARVDAALLVSSGC